MRYELSDYEWSVIKPVLPNKPRGVPRVDVLADRGYDADWIRQFVREKGAWANIPPKRNRTSLINFSPDPL
jgi:transposase